MDKLDPYTSIVFLFVAESTDKKTGRVHITVANIAGRTNISSKIVARSLEKLIKLEYIKKESEDVYVLERVTKKRPPANFNPTFPMTRKLEELWDKWCSETKGESNDDY